MKDIGERIKRLPPEDQKEVSDFIDSLIGKKRSRPKRKPTFSWAGGLRDLRDRFTSVQLQHEISRLRTKEK
ncbi:MAG: DUF2281 domain-containing protein [Deltaproteobacteria bacterium]|nr:DUF2281 domain-containing protein [Candidatus Zymogenaceae bacterium]